MKKVYCYDCRNLLGEGLGFFLKPQPNSTEWRCRIGEKKVDTFLKVMVCHDECDYPENKNANNDCLDFESKRGGVGE